MSYRDNIVELAMKEIGTKETPVGSNNVKYNTWYYGREVSGEDYAWCTVFVRYIFNKAGCLDALPSNSVRCTEILREAREKGLIKYTTPEPGDLILFDSNNDGAPEHIGIYAGQSGTKIVTIEGNTSNGVYKCNHAKYGWCISINKEQKVNVVSKYSDEAVQWCKDNGILKGNKNGDFNLGENATIEKVCVLLYRLKKEMKG